MVMPIQIYVPNRDGGIGVVGFASKSGGIRVFRKKTFYLGRSKVFNEIQDPTCDHRRDSQNTEHLMDNHFASRRRPWRRIEELLSKSPS